MSFSKIFVLCLLMCPLGAASCANDDDGTPHNHGLDQTGSSCRDANDCFPRIADSSTLQGETICITRVQDGYCTHTCVEDQNCCAVPGECLTEFPQVCSPFESMGDKYCFLSCEDSDIRAYEGELFPDGAAIDADLFCQRRAHSAFICRSSGGGAENRKVCVPSG